MPAALQGNGMAAIFQGDSRVTTFDMHGAEAPGFCLIDTSDACSPWMQSLNLASSGRLNLASSGNTGRKP